MERIINSFRFTTVPPPNEIKRSARDMQRQTATATKIKTTVKITVKTKKCFRPKPKALDFLGVPGGNRTPDQRIRSPLLYPLSYWDTGLPVSDKKMERVKGIEPS